MAITLFYRFVITFADAKTPDVHDLEGTDRVYRIAESPQHRWTIVENEQPVLMSDEQHARLVHLLAALEPPPDPAIEPTFPGADGTWATCVIQRGEQQRSYRWWVRPPSHWDVLGTITEYVQQLANIPCERVAQQQRHVVRQFFDCLAARDLPGMLACYHPDAQYSNPFFELHGVEVAAMWRMWWSYLPDVRVVCKERDIHPNCVYWEATYTYPPTGRRIVHRLSTDLTFADGTIIRHVDRFTIHEWAQQAYGVVGSVVGGWRLFAWWLAVQARARLAQERRLF